MLAPTADVFFSVSLAGRARPVGAEQGHQRVREHVFGTQPNGCSSHHSGHCPVPAPASQKRQFRPFAGRPSDGSGRARDMSALAWFKRETHLAGDVAGRVRFRRRIIGASCVADAEVMLRVLVVTF